ncbi:hypothetical protein KP803_18985 [Vibrio sp. ZSDE26]|uniref:Pilus assembly protein PilW n=1 Tax=Vibrio amylolyticus TaxID=2847292 RepID=A0A9X2BIT1_9VIBR|nr:hypothetical protein [Vibrio amylolyticus]MCK6265356.1 hypothetical protein [Vibrio amylolyticus]
MAIKAAKHQKGIAMIEVMVSALIGIIALGIIGSVFLTGQKIAKERTLELLVLQSLMSTSSMMRADMQRAGFDGGSGNSLTLQGATSTVAVSGASIGFVYYLPNINKYQNIKYRLSDGSLYSCERKDMVIASLDNLTGCANLLDQNIMKVVSMAITTTPLVTSSATNLLTHVYLEAELLDGGYNQSVSMAIKQRNWL